ncbi:hypothetical protein BLNAU_11795 [Blattamonas nauphoetae]|uniref:Ubiquitin-like domain-containing protein n=1 Tax=Blattamonas nauphoetae TaxID=2049346 RepID=A0ABQ9XLN2_9EUKA|nr:hypothetical protein BLNAU_11795 [Blattamonas nauphoetae]
MTLFIRIPNTTPVVVRADITSSVLSLMQAIEMKTGIRCARQRLLYHSKQLRPDSLLCHYPIADLCTLDMSFSLAGGKWDLKFRIKNQAPLSITVNDSDTLEQVKLKIGKEFGIKAEHIATVLFRGFTLKDDSKKMEELGLRDEEVTIILRLPHPPPFSEEEEPLPAQ